MSAKNISLTGFFLVVLILLHPGCSKKEEPAKIADQKPLPEEKLPTLKKEEIAITIPAGHEIFSVVVDDADGRRVRNLLSMQPVEKFGGNPASGQPQKIVVGWDGKMTRGRLSLPENIVSGEFPCPVSKLFMNTAGITPATRLGRGIATVGGAGITPRWRRWPARPHRRIRPGV
ncbi:hypothetical protein QQ054_19460 [Oscillatoria amoena NRMC-F 0135]|nr:hypothetical protein [Oscillatoria amoena NRMC-F 0135]